MQGYHIIKGYGGYVLRLTFEGSEPDKIEINTIRKEFHLFFLFDGDS